MSNNEVNTEITEEKKPEQVNKAKLFIENFLVYGLGGIISRIVPFIMVPFVVALMPTKEYFGISDMSNTIISFGSALAVIGMYDAMYRMFFDKESIEYKKTVCSTAMVFTLCTSIVVTALMLLIRKPLSVWTFKDASLSYIIFLSAVATLVSATNSIVSAPTRMQNKRKVFLITNTISPILSYSIAIPLIIKGYYTIALPLATAVAGVTMEASFLIMNRKWFDVKLFDKALLKRLLVIAVPLFPNFLIYWIFNYSDRVMITNLIDVGAEGVYSVGSKLGHASQLIYTAFAGGWQYFAFSTMKEKDQVKSNSNIFEYLAAISFTATAFICAITFWLYDTIFPDDYLPGCVIAPYLFLAPLLQMLFQVACNQFIVIKKTWPNMLILSVGAIANIILNLVLIPMLGIEGASIATLTGYILSDIIVVIVLCRMKLMVATPRLILMSLGMLAFFVIWRVTSFDRTLPGLLMASVFAVICALLYKKELEYIVDRIKTLRKGKKNEPGDEPEPAPEAEA